MSKGGIILLLGLALGTAAFSGFYFLGTAPCRHIMQESQPELAWLRNEFGLSEAEFARITELHEAYLPQCAERCRVIEAENARLRALLAKGATMTPEIQNLLLERAKTRAQCETEMLRHFQEVSRTMPAEQGRRYLVWVQEQTVLRTQAMESRHHADGHHRGAEENRR